MTTNTYSHTRTKHKPVLHHFTVLGVLGFPPGVRCWCGGELTFKLHETDQDAKRKAFFDAHEECQLAEVNHG